MKLPTDWQRVYLLSKIAGAENHQDLLPHNPIQWPKGWLQQRIAYLREQEGKENR